MGIHTDRIGIFNPSDVARLAVEIRAGLPFPLYLNG